MADFQLLRILSLSVILLCSLGLFYFALSVNVFNGRLIDERDKLEKHVHELELLNVKLKAALDMQGELHDEPS